LRVELALGVGLGLAGGLVLLALQALDLGLGLVVLLDLRGLALEFVLQRLQAPGFFFLDLGGDLAAQFVSLLRQALADRALDGFLLLLAGLVERLALGCEPLGLGLVALALLFQPRLVLRLQFVLDLVVQHVTDVELVPALGALDGDVGSGPRWCSPRPFNRRQSCRETTTRAGRAHQVLSG